MSIEENKAVVRRYREAHNTNNLSLLDDVLAPMFVAHEMLPNVPQTIEGAKMIHQSSVAVFPDVQLRTDALFAEGDKVVEQWTMIAHHTGAPFFVGNIPPSGNKVEVTGITTYRIAGGKIVETWSNMDFLGVLQQVGVIPPPAPPGR
jgi:predicted ester cyclase